MLRTLATRQGRRRKGAILIVVLAMLVLFAVLGLSFVLYSEAQLSTATNAKEAINTESPPDVMKASEFWLGALMYDVSDTGDDLMNPIRGHSLARSRLSIYLDPTTGAVVPTYMPYSSPPIPAEGAGFNFNGITNSKLIVRHTWDAANNIVYDPERSYGGNPALLRQGAGAYANPILAANGTYAGKDYPYTYPDRHDFYLAQMDPTTGQVVAPSFHRDDLFGSLDPSNVNWTNATGKWLTLRPRPQDHNGFPYPPMNPDGTYTGDVANLKFITGSQKNDSLWMDAGGPVLRWRGKTYKAFVAPLVLDLSGRLNLSVAGNLRNTNTAAAQYPHGSKEGFGPSEVNPLALGLTPTDLQAIVTRRQGNNATPQNDPYTGLGLTHRINGLQHPLLTGGRIPHQYALTDADGNGPAYTGTPQPTSPDGPLTLPPGGGYATTPIFNQTAATPMRYESTLAELTNALTGHPFQYNPLLNSRQPQTGVSSGFGHDDLVKLYARYSDPKGRQAQTTSVPNPTSVPPVTSLATNAQLRALTTTFSTSQQWANVQVNGVLSTALTPFPPTAALTTTPSFIGPVDLNRPLADYRKDPTQPFSPVNVWNSTPPPAVNPEYQYWLAAQSARQRLARDIFIRMAARYQLLDGTTAVYVIDTGNVAVLTDPAADPKAKALAQLAQLAVNLVDFIDGDDIVTPFVWRPVNPLAADPQNDPANYDPANVTETRVVYGTELPRLVINEVYSGLFNDRTEEKTPPNMNKSAVAAKRRYWVELYNPLPADAASADGGAARLQYQTTVTPMTTFTGTTYNPYRIDVAVAPAPAMVGTPVTPYSTALLTARNNGGFGAGVRNPQDYLTPASAVLKAQVNQYVHDTNSEPAAAMPPPAPLAGTDGQNVVQPDNGTSTLPGGTNTGYYLIGPRDQFPSTGVINSLNLGDVAAAATPVNALSFDAAAAPLADDTAVTAELGKTSVVILRRLLNPYQPPNDPANAGATLYDARFPYDATKTPNPYITVDFVENVPTRDRMKYTATGLHNGPNPAPPTVGRVHPFAAAPAYGTTVTGGVTAVQDQIPPMGAMSPPTPFHTFFSLNNQATLENVRGAGPQYGFEWLVHLDRELASLPEAAHVSLLPPGLLTQQFFSGIAGTGYHNQETSLSGDLLRQFTPAIAPPLQNLRLADLAGLLECGNRLPGVPLGGRVPGKVNANTVNDVRVLNAVFDPQPGNEFFTSNPGFAGTLWRNILPAKATPNTPLYPGMPATLTPLVRTPDASGAPRATISEGGSDYPFAWGSRGATFRDSPMGRQQAWDTATSSPAGPPVFLNFAAQPATTLGYPHPHFRNEPLRKAWNNLTPVSDSFLLIVTVGFFEVTPSNPALPISVTNQPVFGAELFDKVPGDLRAQFAGVVDRSQLATHIAAVDPTTGQATAVPITVGSDTPANRVPRGMQTKLVSDVGVSAAATTIDIEAVVGGATVVAPDGTPVPAGTCAILGDGVTFVIGGSPTTPTYLRVGYGEGDPNPPTNTPVGDGEWVQVIGVAQRTLPNASGVATVVPGQVTLTITPWTRPNGTTVSVARPHAASSPVGNVLFGNPGPQPGVRLSDLQRRGVVPYFTRLEP